MSKRKKEGSIKVSKSFTTNNPKSSKIIKRGAVLSAIEEKISAITIYICLA